jgi:uncharacterized UPF0160 family protein
MFHRISLKLPEGQAAEIVRTREAAVLDGCDIVVDVGAVFDPSIQRYDHHQRLVVVTECLNGSALYESCEYLFTENSKKPETAWMPQSHGRLSSAAQA